VPECPITIAECVFGQTSEGGEYEPAGHGDGGSVWFVWTPTSDETGVQIRTGLSSSDSALGSSPPYFTEYDTTLAVYTGSPGSLTLVDEDDDSDTGSLSEVVIDVTAGTTYYIQVSGRDPGDEGRLLLTLECRNQVAELIAYWGFPVFVVT
jgi:hypothetical protein